VTVLEPVSSGTAALQSVVPDAVPDAPVDVDQLTEATPTLSDVVPRNVIEAETVETVVKAGLTMRIEGGVRSDEPGEAGGLAGGVGVVGSVGVLGVVGFAGFVGVEGFVGLVGVEGSTGLAGEALDCRSP